MGFRYRKSISLGGGFKINLSKSGIGYSWGTKGYRVSRTARGTTRTTYSIPGTGISYVRESGNRRSSAAPQNRNYSRTVNQPQPKITMPSYVQGAERAIQSASISQFKEAEEGTISDALERTIKLNWMGCILLFGVLLIPFSPFLALIPLVGLALIIAAHTAGRVSAS